MYTNTYMFLEREILLQHAYVYNLKHIIFLVADLHSIILIQGIIVQFDEAILDDYGKVLSSLKQTVFDWIPMYKEEESANDSTNIASLFSTTIPDDVVEVAVQDQTVSTISDKEALCSAFKLWVADVFKHECIPFTVLDERNVAQHGGE